MNKALMISIQPQHAVNILNGDKDRELRKWIPKGYVGLVYAYVALPKGIKDIIVWHPYHCKWVLWGDVMYDDDMANWNPKNLARLNGKVAFRFWFDEYEKYQYDLHGMNRYSHTLEYDIEYTDLDKLCLDYTQVENYGKGKTLYAWHIKKLEIFDEPKQLSEFYKDFDKFDTDANGNYVGWYHIGIQPIQKAPQRSVWVYVEDKELEK